MNGFKNNNKNNKLKPKNGILRDYRFMQMNIRPGLRTEEEYIHKADIPIWVDGPLSYNTSLQTRTLLFIL